MGLFGFLKKRRGRTVADLARSLEISEMELRTAQPSYRHFRIPKRAGGTRLITAPDDKTKTIQRRVLRRILGRLRAHPAAHGFERDRSIVSNALPHVDKDVVVRLDIKDFFPSTGDERVQAYLNKVGWNREAAQLLTHLCTFKGRLPQGAPTSPRLSNLVNFLLDARLSALAQHFEADYTRYADDMTFSFGLDQPGTIHALIRSVKNIVAEFGYQIHEDKKLHIRRLHSQQKVTGLVVNQKVQLPRKTRRWLRAVEHRTFMGSEASLTPRQLAGWISLRTMIEKQSRP